MQPLNVLIYDTSIYMKMSFVKFLQSYQMSLAVATGFSDGAYNILWSQ